LAALPHLAAHLATHLAAHPAIAPARNRQRNYSQKARIQASSGFGTDEQDSWAGYRDKTVAYNAVMLSASPRSTHA
jgi:hypothetical protein